MKKMVVTVIGGILLGVLLPALCAAQEQTPAQGSAAQAQTTPQPQAAAQQQSASNPAIPPDPKATMIPAGSVLHIRLTNTLTSKTNKNGDQFTGEVTQAVLVEGKEIIPVASTVNGHVTYAKSSGRIHGKAELRIVLDGIETPDNLTYPLSAGLADLNAGKCAKMGSDNEGTIEGCGKSMKGVAKDAAIAGGIGAGMGGMIGLESRGGCTYYGCYPTQGPGIGADIGYGAGIGAGTVLIYSLLKHEKQIILVQGTELTFVINRSSTGGESPSAAADSGDAKPAAQGSNHWLVGSLNQ
jgi:hypothetical protein